MTDLILRLNAEAKPEVGSAGSEISRVACHQNNVVMLSSGLFRQCAPQARRSTDDEEVQSASLSESSDR